MTNRYPRRVAMYRLSDFISVYEVVCFQPDITADVKMRNNIVQVAILNACENTIYIGRLSKQIGQKKAQSAYQGLTPL